MGYYKVTYNPPGQRNYNIVVASQEADSKWHAIELAYNKEQTEYPDRKLYKAKLLK